MTNFQNYSAVTLDDADGLENTVHLMVPVKDIRELREEIKKLRSLNMELEQDNYMTILDHQRTKRELEVLREHHKELEIKHEQLIQQIEVRRWEQKALKDQKYYITTDNTTGKVDYGNW